MKKRLFFETVLDSMFLFVIQKYFSRLFQTEMKIE